MVRKARRGLLGILGSEVRTARLRSEVRTARLRLQPPQGKEGRRQEAAPTGLASLLLAVLLARALLLWRWIH